ncbi:MAG: hybrid sensor histidine kinase/response regulator, partial [Deltaproteobacteria bacterium]|nr:hybrid sensor histidine kinase/response regulator [Deltaproteobacteria bacterium]
MRAKLITLFVVIKVVPLVLLALVAWTQSHNLGEELRTRTESLAQSLTSALAKTGDVAVHDAMDALNARATEDIERITTDAARHLAEFLYARDGDIRLAAKFKPDAALYRDFLENSRSDLMLQGEWALNKSGTEWEPVTRGETKERIRSSNTENDRSFNYRAPGSFSYESRPLFLEMTLVGLDGKEKLKVTTSPRMDPKLKDVSVRANTYLRAETYFAELRKLRPGEIYVSEVIGAYVGSRVINHYTPATAAKAGEEFAPEKSAYAGRENPLGERFKGLIRWASPVLEKGKIVGYVTLALDHDHILEFVKHIMPTAERYTELSDASDGNYAFIWDFKGRSIAHARHFSIVGYNPETGDPEIPWLEDRIYDEWQASGEPYPQFIERVPTFAEQSVKKKPARELTRQGLVGLDCRYLNFAPQCTGWFDLTRDGGSGSFVILWSGLQKLTTAAAIPYYTGQYAASRRGFGFVTVGASVDDFYRPALETKTTLDKLIDETDEDLKQIARDTQTFINRNLMETATGLAVSTGCMAIVVILIAIWMASVFTRSITTLILGISRFRSGERHFRFNSPVKDEMGTLADSFDDMADSIVNSETNPLVIMDTARTILYMNDAALARVGGGLDGVLGRPYDIFSFHGHTPESDPLAALQENREAGVYHPETGGYFRDNASYLLDKDGKTIGYVVTTTDVSELVSG